MLNTRTKKTKFDEKEFWNDFKKELDDIEKEIELESEQQENKPFNKFYGKEITYDKFLNILESLMDKSILVEIIKGFNTSQYYEDFQWFEYKTSTYKTTLSFQDEKNDEKFPIYFNIEDIGKIIEGNYMYTDSWLIRLKNGSELMLELQ